MTNPEIIQRAIQSNLKEANPQLYSTLKENDELEDYLHRQSARFYDLLEELTKANPDIQPETLEEIILTREIFVDPSSGE